MTETDFSELRKNTDFETSNVNNPFYPKATSTSLSVLLICTQNNHV